MTWERGSADSAGLEALYPFLYSDTNDLDKVLAQVRQSTVDKAHEILELRRIVRDNDGERLLVCAQEMARLFVAGTGAGFQISPFDCAIISPCNFTILCDAVRQWCSIATLIR